MSVEKKMLPRQFDELGDAHNSGESASDGEENVLAQLLDRRLTSSEIVWRINAIVAVLVCMTSTASILTATT